MRYLFGVLFLFLFFVLPVPTLAYTSDDFVITVDTSQPGTTGNNEYMFLTEGTGYNFTVDWGDGSSTTHVGDVPSISYTYAVPGVYTIAITPNEVGGFPEAKFGVFNGDNDKLKILTVEQWGTNQWESFYAIFNQAENLVVKANDVPDLSQVNSFEVAFNSISAIDSDISSWDVSAVTTMWVAFNNIDNFDQDLSGWDVSNVTDMSGMLPPMSPQNYSAILNGWASLPSLQNNVTLDVYAQYPDTAVAARLELTSVYNWTINDDGMFVEPSNARFITSWDTTLAAPTNQIVLSIDGSNANFYIDWGDGNTVFYSDAPGEVSHTYSTPGIKTITFIGEVPRFYFCQGTASKDKLIDVMQWGTNVWQSFDSAFNGCSYITEFSATDAPNLSQITDLSYTFSNSPNFNSSLNNWDVSNVTDMSGMFENASAFNGSIADWNVSNVNNMRGMFQGATSFNQLLNNWDVSNVTNMDSIFAGATAFNGDIRNWNVSNVTNMQSLFENAASFNQDLSVWDITNASFDWIGFNGTALSTSNYTKILEAWSQLSLSPMSFGEIGPSSSLTPYCSNVQTAYDLLRSIWYDWTDGGPVSCTTATYLTSAGGALLGDTFQYIADGEGGTAVTVVPADGYRFVSWSDGSTANPRIDSNLPNNISVTAVLELGAAESSGNSTAIGVRAERLGEMIADTPVVASITTFVSSVRDFLDYLTANEDEIEKMTAEERTKVIVALRDIIAFLLKMVPGV